MIKSKYKTKHFYYQYAITFFQIIYILFDFSVSIYLTTVLFLLLLKIIKQGSRINLPLFIIMFLFTILQFRLLRNLSIVLLLVSIYKLKVYQFPKTKNNIGYKNILVKNNVEFFYRTNSTTQLINLNIFDYKVFKLLHDIVNKDLRKPSKLPFFSIIFIFHYYTKILINSLFKNSTPNEQQYEVVIISHQLGIKSLYHLSLELADRGYFVIFLTHPQKIINKFKKSQDNRPWRMEQLHNRFLAVKQILDLISNKQKLNQLFNSQVNLNYRKIHILGHSFGGSTALYSAINDNRITGSVICLDPCAYIFSDQISYQQKQLKYTKNTLILLAQDYYLTHYPQFQNDYRIYKIKNNCKKYNSSFQIIRLMGVNHASFSELALLNCGQFQLFNVIQNNDALLYMQFFIQCIISHLNFQCNTQKQFIDKVSENFIDGKYKNWIQSVCKIDEATYKINYA